MAGMDDVPSEILRAAYERKPIYLLKVPLFYGLWAGGIALLWQTQDSPFAIPIGIAVSLLVANLVRGLGSVAHDAVHGSVSKSKTISYLVALIIAFGALALTKQIGTENPPAYILAQTLVLGFPAMVGGAAGRIAVWGDDRWLYQSPIRAARNLKRTRLAEPTCLDS